MAGTLLLINKRNADDREFSQKKNDLQQKVEKVFGKFYQRILIHTPTQNSFLIEFRNDDEAKFVKDGEGNWLTYEGTVFALNQTHTYSAHELLALYFQDKQKFPNQLDGHFVIKLYDVREDKYIVVNDFIKNKTNFLCETDRYIMFSPFALTTGIIKKPELDLEAFNEFLWRYYILSERSMLKGVTRLKPASVYQFRKNSLIREKYWEWPKKYTQVPFKEAVSRTVESMKETARLISGRFGKPCIDFTMGQDTRQVISAFTNQGIDFTTSIFGKTDFYEVQEIKEIARELDIENTNIQLNSDYTENLWQHFKDSILLGSCEEPGYLIGRLIYMRKQQSKLAKVLINGMEGRFYKNGLWDEMYTFNFYREPKEFNVDMFLRMRALSKDFPDTFFKNEYLEVKKYSQHYFRNIILKTIKNYKNSPVSIQVDYFDINHWFNFAVVSNNSGNLIHNSISPLMLRRNLEFAVQVPVKWRFNLSRFQRAVVYRLDPELAKIKTDFAGVNMVPKNIFTIVPFYCRYFYFQSEKLRKKVMTKMGIPVKSHLQEAWDYQPLYRKLLSDESFRKNLNYENMHLKKIIREEEWNHFIKKYDNPEKTGLSDYEFLFK
ncbi:MAG: hypothetical protein ACOC2M_00375, partial [bacterium]